MWGREKQTVFRQKLAHFGSDSGAECEPVLGTGHWLQRSSVLLNTPESLYPWFCSFTLEQCLPLNILFSKLVKLLWKRGYGVSPSFHFLWLSGGGGCWWFTGQNRVSITSKVKMHCSQLTACDLYSTPWGRGWGEVVFTRAAGVSFDGSAAAWEVCRHGRQQCSFMGPVLQTSSLWKFSIELIHTVGPEQCIPFFQ